MPRSAGCRRRRSRSPGTGLGASHVLCGRAGLGAAHAARAMAGRLHALWAAGQAHGIADYGSFAMNALRMEKGFKGAGELTNEVTLPEADVMRFVKPDKDFLGRTTLNTALEAAALGLRLSGNRAGRRLTAMAARRCAGWRGGRLDRVGRLWSYGRQDPRLRLHQAARRRTRHVRQECSARRPTIRRASAAHRCTGMRSRAMSAAPDTMRAMVLTATASTRNRGWVRHERTRSAPMKINALTCGASR
jgi:hypothetical protein